MLGVVETDSELVARYGRVKSDLEQAQARIERMKPGIERMKLIRWSGWIQFNLLRIEAKMLERGLIQEAAST